MAKYVEIRKVAIIVSNVTAIDIIFRTNERYTGVQSLLAVYF